MTDLRIGFDDGSPRVRLDSLDALWFQVSGTICNLRCRHCFISCSPENNSFGFMSADECRRHLNDAAVMGVREFYFTGGEPFANPQMCDILEEAVRIGPATVLTNATLLNAEIPDRLREINESTIYSIEFRVSLDGFRADVNDPIRGEGVFEQAMGGIIRLVEHGFLPIVTAVRSWTGNDAEALDAFAGVLRQRGYDRPRLKIMPLLRLGAGAAIGGAYDDRERVTTAMMRDYDAMRLVCSSSRVVTNRGVWVCPILLNERGGRMGDTLGDSARDHALWHPACVTCWSHGSICSNVSTAAAASIDG